MHRKKQHDQPHRHQEQPSGESGRALGLVQLAVLSVIDTSPGHAAYGSAIAEKIEKMFGREVSDAQIYMALTRLKERRLIVSRSSEEMPSERKRGRPKVYYALEDTGRRALASAGAWITSSDPFVSSPVGGEHGDSTTKTTPKPTAVVVPGNAVRGRLARA